MRKELKDFNWHVYGLNTYEFSHTIELVEEFIEARNSQLDSRIKNMEITDFDGNPIDIDSDGANEAISDISYYHFIDNYIIFQFGLWRLQGIFEGILKQEFFSMENINGLKKKLDKIRVLGYNIASEDYNELIEWGQLRNALSHFPPEKYRPAALDSNDLLEYKVLVERVSKNLISQKVN